MSIKDNLFVRKYLSYFTLAILLVLFTPITTHAETYLGITKAVYTSPEMDAGQAFTAEWRGDLYEFGVGVGDNSVSLLGQGVGDRNTVTLSAGAHYDFANIWSASVGALYVLTDMDTSRNERQVLEAVQAEFRNRHQQEDPRMKLDQFGQVIFDEATYDIKNGYGVYAAILVEPKKYLFFKVTGAVVASDEILHAYNDGTPGVDAGGCCWVEKRSKNVSHVALTVGVKF